MRIILLLLCVLSHCTTILIGSPAAAAEDDVPDYTSASSLPTPSSFFPNQSESVKVKVIETGHPDMHIIVVSSANWIRDFEINTNQNLTKQGLAFPKSELKSGSMMAANLISMSNSSQAEEFLQMMGNAIKNSLITPPPPPQPLTPLPHSYPLPRDKHGHGRLMNTMEEAACEPELRTIDLSEYTFTSRDPDIAVYPRCVRVPRCGGCCGPSDMLQCMPTNITMNNVMLRKWSLNAKHAKKSMTQELVPIEYHESCACQCRIQEKDCDPEKQRYSKEKCKCMCLSSRDHKKCVMNPDKVWNPGDCTCKCRNIKRCSTGLKFNPDTCSCQIVTED